ncbi:MAG: hypothetical protein LWX07_04440, partial [Bacteroidetes bacterium]|nr:hypothetical protein [Bacteroidota bacterium]
ILFLINDFSFISVYLPMKSLARKLYSELRDSDEFSSELTVITSSSEVFLKAAEQLISSGEDEFVYEGELYDICGVKITNGTAAIYCIKDTKENSLDNLFTTHVEKKDYKNISRVINNILSTKKFTAYLNTSNIFLNAGEISFVYSGFQILTTNPFLGTDTPPPRVS